MESLRILVFNWRCWLNPAMGGAEVFTREVARRWVKAGHEVTLFCSEFPNCKREEVVDGVRVVRAGGKYSVYWRAKKYYRERFSGEGFDVVVDEVNTRPFFVSKFVDNGESVVSLIHQLAREFWFYEVPFPLSFVGYYFLEPRWLKSIAGVPAVTVSESTRRDLLGFGFRRVFVVSEGLSIEPLDAVPEKEGFPVVLFVGRLKRAKRPDHALETFRFVKERFPRAELWVVGDGYFRRKLERMGFVGVRFFGRVSEGVKCGLLRRGWVLVHPSVREGWGLNVVEAAGFGVPTVAYDVAGLRDSVRDGVTGLLVEDGDVEGLGEALIRVLGDGGLRLRLSKNALEYARGFSWDRTAEEFLKVLEWTVNER
jgi:glycosyltransferase involved in cell wall biosynthesis